MPFDREWGGEPFTFHHSAIAEPIWKATKTIPEFHKTIPVISTNTSPDLYKHSIRSPRALRSSRALPPQITYQIDTRPSWWSPEYLPPQVKIWIQEDIIFKCDQGSTVTLTSMHGKDFLKILKGIGPLLTGYIECVSSTNYQVKYAIMEVFIFFHN